MKHINNCWKTEGYEVKWTFYWEFDFLYCMIILLDIIEIICQKNYMYSYMRIYEFLISHIQ